MKTNIWENWYNERYNQTKDLKANEKSRRIFQNKEKSNQLNYTQVNMPIEVRMEDIYYSYLDFLKQNNCKNVLELGCGEGKLMYIYNEMLPKTKVVGIDFTRKVLLSAFEENKELDAKEFVHGNVYNLPFKSNSFDAITIVDLLHHLVGNTRSENKKLVLNCMKEVMRVSKNNSCILIYDISLKYKTLSYLVYWMTLICSKLKIQIPSLEIINGIIISFYTPKELNDIILESKIKCFESNIEKTLFPYLKPCRYFFIGKKV